MTVAPTLGALPPAPWDPPRGAPIQPACRNHHLGWQAWFPADRLADQQPLHQAAIAVCHGCPLLDPCREWALAQMPELIAGIWGGTTEGDRSRARQRKHYLRRKEATPA